MREKYLSTEETEEENTATLTVDITQEPTVNANHQKIIDFYYRDEVSRQMPGKKDYKVILNRSSGLKEKVQIRFMTMTGNEAYEMFLLENPDIHVRR